MVLGDESTVFRIGEREPDRQPGVDTQFSIWVRSIERFESAYERRSSHRFLPLSEEPLTESVGLSVRGIDGSR